MRYYCEKTGKCVEKFILAKTIDNETAAVVADCFLDWSRINKIDIATHLIMINSDHASTLRGSKNGAVLKILIFTIILLIVVRIYISIWGELCPD